MKKILLLSITIFSMQLVTAQYKPGTGVATLPNTKVINKKIPTTKSNKKGGDENYTNSCYSGFAFTVKNYGYNKGGNFYSWGIMVKNNYTKAVQLRYKLIVGNDESNTATLTYYIKPGDTYTNDYGTLKALIVDNNSTSYRIEVSEVCFEGQDCIKNGYVDCSGKQTGEDVNKTVAKQNEPAKNNTPIAAPKTAEELKSIILENLKTFTDKELHTEKTYPNDPNLYKKNITDVAFAIINDELHINWVSNDYCVGTYCAPSYPKKYETIIGLKVIKFITNYGGSIKYSMGWEIESKYIDNRTYQNKCKEYLDFCKKVNLGESQKYTDDCQLVGSYFTPSIPYKEGDNKINLKELDKAFRDLYKLLNGK